MRDFTKEIEKILDKLGMNIAHKGYRYWVFAAIIKIRYFKATMGEVYSELAKDYGVSTKTIERNMYHAINSGNVNAESQKYFNLKYKITSSVFLECLVREVQQPSLKE